MIELSVFWYESCRKCVDAFVYIVITHVTKITRSVNWPKSLYAMHRGILNSVTKTRMPCRHLHADSCYYWLQRDTRYGSMIHLDGYRLIYIPIRHTPLFEHYLPGFEACDKPAHILFVFTQQTILALINYQVLHDIFIFTFSTDI